MSHLNLNNQNRRGSGAGANADYSPIRFRGQSNQLAPVSQVAKEDYHSGVSTVKRRVAPHQEEVEMGAIEPRKYRNPNHKGRHQNRGEDDYDYALRVQD